MDLLNIATYGPFHTSTTKTFYIINSYGSISISSTPSSSNVYLDNSFKGTTPLTIQNVPIGSHTIKLSKSGYNDISRTVTVSSGRTTTVSESLSLHSGSIKVSSNPSSANVYLDGTFKGTTPTTLSNVPTGSHVIKITKSGYNDISKSVTVSSSHTSYISENLESIIISHPTAAVTEEQTSSPTYDKGISYEKNNTTLPIIVVFIILTLIFIIKGRKKSADSASNSNSSPPPKITQPSAKETTPLTTTAATIQKPKDKGTIDIKSAFQYKGATIQYKVKIINQTPEPISDIKIQLFVPEVFMLTQKEKSIPMLEPDESKTVTFDIRPTGECGDCIVSGLMNYYDYSTKKRQDVDIKKKMISIVCPVLKRKEIYEDGWRNATEELIKAEENTKDLDIPAENLFNIATRVLKDMSMYMIPPEITSTPQLFTGVGMFYADGAAGLRYAAYIEVVGGRKSRMILKAWAEKEEALTGFYHKILDEIEKRLDIKVFIDEGIIQHHVHKTEIKDNIIQRSNINLGTRAQCPECGREVEANEKFCLECGAKL
ncbi:MAG: PEGA domain-containing protein [Methanosarcinales archaeon]|nr:PEGA domain-containing protein [Methanosarcinales archaeon]